MLAVDEVSPSPAAIREAALVLARGGLVAFPTETVYGLGARGLHEDEVARIFAAKGRPSLHPLILHVDGSPMAERLARSWPEAAASLAAAFWPGPLTLIVPRAAIVPANVSGGLPTVGLRAPRHGVAQALISAVGEPLAAPSANAHTHVSPTTAAHVVRSLGDRVDVVLDSGPTEHGIESTVVDVTCDPPRVLRPGALGLEPLRTVVPSLRYESAVALEGEARASPGQAKKHYAPRARVVVADASELAHLLQGAARGVLLVFGEEAKKLPSSIVLPSDPAGYARELFAALHRAEAEGADLVGIERPPDSPGWWAVRDRVRRATQE